MKITTKKIFKHLSSKVLDGLLVYVDQAVNQQNWKLINVFQETLPNYYFVAVLEQTINEVEK